MPDLLPLSAVVVGILGSAACLFASGWHAHHHFVSDPSHVDHLARKDRRIAELENSNAKLKMQRDKSLEAYRRLKDEQRSAL